MPTFFSARCRNPPLEGGGGHVQWRQFRLPIDSSSHPVHLPPRRSQTRGPSGRNFEAVCHRRGRRSVDFASTSTTAATAATSFHPSCDGRLRYSNWRSNFHRTNWCYAWCEAFVSIGHNQPCFSYSLRDRVTKGCFVNCLVLNLTIAMPFYFIFQITRQSRRLGHSTCHFFLGVRVREKNNWTLTRRYDALVRPK